LHGPSVFIASVWILVPYHLCFSNQYQGYLLDIFIINSSLSTLATIDAAHINGTLASQSIIVVMFIPKSFLIQKSLFQSNNIQSNFVILLILLYMSFSILYVISFSEKSLSKSIQSIVYSHLFQFNRIGFMTFSKYFKNRKNNHLHNARFRAFVSPYLSISLLSAVQLAYISNHSFSNSVISLYSISLFFSVSFFESSNSLVSNLFNCKIKPV